MVSAIVVVDPMGFGTSRQYEACAQCDSQRTIFSDADTALSWLIEYKAGGDVTTATADGHLRIMPCASQGSVDGHTWRDDAAQRHSGPSALAMRPSD